MPVIDVQNLHKTYGETVAVADVSFSVEEGEIFGILGRNGAGKTTTVECIEGLRRPDGGTISVLGLDPVADTPKLRRVLGAQLQEAGLPPKLRVGEAMRMFASFYDDPADGDALLRRLGIESTRDTAFAKLSGGQKQRLSIALALIGRPRVVVLDELTAGLDVQARREAWHLVEEIRDDGVTVVLVTHFMDEAERLCDRVAIVDLGQVIALGSPRELIASLGGEHVIEFTLDPDCRHKIVPRDQLSDLPAVSSVLEEGEHVILSVGEPHVVLPALLERLARLHCRLTSLTTRHASLEDVFVKLAGRHLDETESASP
jgi:ABC-2 type transport system ATP-binding protein